MQNDSPALHALIGDDERSAAFNSTANVDQCLEYESANRNDMWGEKDIQARLGMESVTVLQSHARDKRNDALRQLLVADVSIHQIERLTTGISRGVIQNVNR